METRNKSAFRHHLRQHTIPDFFFVTIRARTATVALVFIIGNVKIPYSLSLLEYAASDSGKSAGYHRTNALISVPLGKT